MGFWSRWRRRRWEQKYPGWEDVFNLDQGLATGAFYIIQDRATQDFHLRRRENGGSCLIAVFQHGREAERWWYHRGIR